jgi:hypothetical protein
VSTFLAVHSRAAFNAPSPQRNAADAEKRSGFHNRQEGRALFRRFNVLAP